MAKKPDVLEETRAPLVKRAEELRPAFDEYNEIQDVLSRLDGPSAAAAPLIPKSRPRAVETSKPSTKPRRRGRVKGSGSRRAEVLKTIVDNPGLTVAEIATKMKMDKSNYIYRVAGELAAEGLVRKDGSQYFAVETS